MRPTWIDLDQIAGNINLVVMGFPNMAEVLGSVPSLAVRRRGAVPFLSEMPKDGDPQVFMIFFFFLSPDAFILPTVTSYLWFLSYLVLVFNLYF